MIKYVDVGVVGYLLKRLNESGFLKRWTWQLLAITEWINHRPVVECTWMITSIPRANQEWWTSPIKTLQEIQYLMSGKCTEETTYQTSIDGRTIDEFHRSISRPKLAGWLLVPEAIFRGSVRITWLATWPIKKLLNIYARGPAFREDVVVSPFNTVDLYPLMSKLLGINPRPNNGSIENVTVVLRQPPIRPIRRSSQFEAWVRKDQHFFWTK